MKKHTLGGLSPEVSGPSSRGAGCERPLGGTSTKVTERELKLAQETAPTTKTLIETNGVLGKGEWRPRVLMSFQGKLADSAAGLSTTTKSKTSPKKRKAL